MCEKIVLICLALTALCTLTRAAEDTPNLNGAPEKVAASHDIPKTVLHSVHPSKTSGFLTPPTPNYDEINLRLSAAKHVTPPLPISGKYEHKSGDPHLDHMKLISAAGFLAPIMSVKLPANSGYRSNGQQPYPPIYPQLSHGVPHTGDTSGYNGGPPYQGSNEPQIYPGTNGAQVYPGSNGAQPYLGSGGTHSDTGSNSVPLYHGSNHGQIYPNGAPVYARSNVEHPNSGSNAESYVPSNINPTIGSNGAKPYSAPDAAQPNTGSNTAQYGSQANPLPSGNKHIPTPDKSSQIAPDYKHPSGTSLQTGAGTGDLKSATHTSSQHAVVKPRVQHGAKSTVSIVSNQPGGNNRQCTFSISNENEFHPSSDDFGYPKYQVEDAFRASIAKDVFDKYIDHIEPSTAASGLSTHVGLGGYNSVPGRLGGVRRNQNIPGRQIPNSQDYGFDPSASALFNNNNGIRDKFNNINNNAGSAFGQNQFPGYRGNAKPFSSDVFGNNGFSPFHFRKRRMAGFGPLNFQQDVQDICPPVSKSLLKSFKKYGTTCFVWAPEKQKMDFVQCSNDKCRTCESAGTSSKCMAEHVERFVWAYCEQGPHAGKMVLEQIKIPAYCTCKLYQC